MIGIAALMLCGALLTACQQGSTAPQHSNGDLPVDVLITRESERVSFRAPLPITQQTVDRLDALLQPGDKLSIRGPGGNVEETLRLIDIVNSRQITVELSGSCYSGCAIVFIAADHKIARAVNPLFFHGTPITGHALSMTHPDLYNETEEAVLERRYQRFMQGLAQHGVAPGIFECADRLSSHRLEEGGARLTSQYAFVWFSNDVLTQFGIDGLPPSRPISQVEKDIFPSTGMTADSIFWADGDVC